LSDNAIKAISDRVVIDGLSIFRFDPCIYGICIDYFTDKIPRSIALGPEARHHKVGSLPVRDHRLGPLPRARRVPGGRARRQGTYAWLRPLILVRRDTKVRSGFLPDRIIHLHPTRLCNLACLHCYSESDPGQRTRSIRRRSAGALEILRAEGYALMSLSGGEPLVYKPLRQVIDRAHELGFRVTMITNGLLVTERTESLLAELDGVAVSFDGLAETHNTGPRPPRRLCARVSGGRAARRRRPSRGRGDLTFARRHSRVTRPRRSPDQPRRAGDPGAAGRTRGARA
jgi:hypothetical protein